MDSVSVSALDLVFFKEALDKVSAKNISQIKACIVGQHYTAGVATEVSEGPLELRQEASCKSTPEVAANPKLHLFSKCVVVIVF